MQCVALDESQRRSAPRLFLDRLRQSVVHCADVIDFLRDAFWINKQKFMLLALKR